MVSDDTSSELRVLRPALFSRLALASMSSLAVSLAMSALLNLGNLKATFSSCSAVTGWEEKAEWRPSFLAAWCNSPLALTAL